MTDLQHHLEQLCRRYGVTSLYAFGSRASEIAARARGEEPEDARPGSDGDFAVQIGDRSVAPGLSLGSLVSELEGLFDLPRADLLVLNDADPFMALEAVRGELICCLDKDVQSEEELRILRVAGDLAPYQKQRIEGILSGELER
jgi:predicted nucleotidyltransferase